MHLNQILKNAIRNLDAVVELQTHSQFYNMELSIHLSMTFLWLRVYWKHVKHSIWKLLQAPFFVGCTFLLLEDNTCMDKELNIKWTSVLD